MSSSDYALSIAQKYRLAISIAVLNTKPHDVTIDEYIDQIRNTISNSEGDVDISVCSDDFNINCIDELDDDQTQNVNQMSCDRDVTQDYIFNDAQGDVRAEVYDVHVVQSNNVQIQENVSQGNKRTQEKNVGSQDTDVKTQRNNVKSQINDSKTKHDSRVQFNEEMQGNNAQDNEKSIILHNHKRANMDKNKERSRMYREVIQVMTGVDSTQEDPVKKHGFICSESSQAKPFDSMDIELTQCSDDNDQTLTERDLMTHENIVTNYPNYYQVQTNDPNVRKDKYALSQDKSEMLNSLENLTSSKETKIASENPYRFIQEDNCLKKTCAIDKEKYVSAPVMDKSNQIITCTAISADVEETLPTIQYTQHNTHYSPSQAHFTIDNRLIIGYNHKTNDGRHVSDPDTEMFSQSTQDVLVDSLNCLTSPDDMAIDLTFKKHSKNNKTHEQNNRIENFMPFPQDIEIDTCQDITEERIEFGPTFLQDMHILDSNEPIESLSASLSFIENKTESQNPHTMEYDEATFKPRFDNTKRMANFDENNDKAPEDTNNDCCANVNENNDKALKDANNCCAAFDKPTDETDNVNREFGTENMIPFKILEEINVIKSYLNKKCLTQSSLDSGYRSSQSKCSFKSSQSANVFKGESANTVFHYLCVCPLVTATQDLTDQMSEVLGQLIDRLHEEEMYPSFLEELLIVVHTLLVQLYEEDCGEFDVLTKKDDQTQRIALLTKSSHIKKFAIEKINEFLQKLLDAPKHTDHETENIAKINNLPYIFHILQTLIPKYSAPSSQNTQVDEKPLRKKDISDLWRRKWIPNFKEISNEGSCEEICVLKECGAILNRVVVDFMEGYSLVAYCALKCFNMLQS